MPCVRLGPGYGSHTSGMWIRQSDVKNVPTRRPHDAHTTPTPCFVTTTLHSRLDSRVRRRGRRDGGRGTGAGDGGGGGGWRSGPLEARREQSATPTTFSFFLQMSTFQYLKQISFSEYFPNSTLCTLYSRKCMLIYKLSFSCSQTCEYFSPFSMILKMLMCIHYKRA